MSVMFILIGVSLVVAIGFLGAFYWSIRTGQFKDDVTPAYRVFLDDVKRETSAESTESKSSQPNTTHAS